ncbi:MAG: hypothetical protein AAGI03_00665 [Pseudomonadota bacterium]
MAKKATAESVNSSSGVDLSNVIQDLDQRVKRGENMKDAKADYDDLCKMQNERRGYNKVAMNMLTRLSKMGGDKFQDCMRTFKGGLDALIESRAETDTPDMIGSVTAKTPPNGIDSAPAGTA